MRFLFGGVVENNDPDAPALRQKCIKMHRGLHLDEIKRTCGESDDLWQTSIFKGGIPYSNMYYNSNEYGQGLL